jgi:mannose-6-phosphate isomerase-like protein (cupin superfamily)
MRPRDASLPLLLVSFFAPLMAQVPKNNLDVQHPPSRSSVAASMDVKRDHCFRSVLENDRVRVFKVDVPGLQSTSLDYHHHDYLLVSLGTSNFEVLGNGIRYPMQMDDGEMQVLKGGASHRISNLSGSPLRLVEMEVIGEVHPERPICGLGKPACTDGIFGRNEAGSYNQSTLFETDTVKLARVQLGAGSLLPEHRHDRCHILVSLADTTLRESPVGSGSRELQLSPGDAQWYSGRVTHTIENLDTRDVQFITVEFK